MNSQIKTLPIFCVLILFLISTNGFSQEISKKEELPQDVAAFKRLVGKWDCTTKIWSGKPGEPAIECQGVSKFNFVLGGQFLHEQYVGKLNKKEYSGVGYWGYDTHKKKFTRTWMDSLSSRMAVSEGTLDAKLKTFTYYGTMDDDVSGKHDKMMRFELDFSDEDKVTFKIFDLTIHKDAKVVEAVYVKSDDESDDESAPTPSNNKSK